MRTIKFRAWDKENNKMDYSPCASEQLGEFTLLNLATKEIQENLILMQFTGFHDDKGKEIFEDDIVMYEDKKCKIEWGFSKAAFVIYKIDSKASLTEIKILEIDDAIEVIGNIYENPDLLK